MSEISCGVQIEYFTWGVPPPVEVGTSGNYAMYSGKGISGTAGKRRDVPHSVELDTSGNYEMYRGKGICGTGRNVFPNIFGIFNNSIK